MSKIVEGDCPETISNLFKKCDNPNYNLRSKGKLLRLSKPNTNAMKKALVTKEQRSGIRKINTQNKKNITIYCIFYYSCK